MTKEELLERLAEIERRYGNDKNLSHPMADNVLIAYIDDPDIQNLYEKLTV